MILFSILEGGWTLITNLVLQQSRGMYWSLANNYRQIENYKSTNSRFHHLRFMSSAHNYPLTNSDFSVTRKFLDEPLISLQRLIVLESTLFNTLQPKQMLFLTHVDLIIVFQMTTQLSHANVLGGAVNTQSFLLVNGISKVGRPLIVCWIIRHLLLP